MPIGDIEKMVAVGLIWGATNAFMRKGAVIWDQKSLESSQSYNPHLLIFTNAYFSHSKAT